MTRRRRKLVIIAIAFALVIGLFVFRSPILTGIARAWIVDNELTQADAILVLGGGIESRPFGAADLWKRGLAPKILITDVRWVPGHRLGVGQPEGELSRQILIRLGIPESALEIIGHQVTSTYDEAMALRTWAATNTTAKRFIIVTDMFHTRRCRWIFRKQLRSTDAQIQLAAVANSDYDPTNWWCHEHGILAFQNEWVKFPVYLLKY